MPDEPTTDLLIRDIGPDLERLLTESARSHGRSLSDEAKALLENELLKSPDQRT
jgi:plasmid stability protein